MRKLGDKASARRVAIAAGVPVIPATEVLGDDMAEVRRQAAEVGYPLMLKASWGGGGRGMRPIESEAELEVKVREGRREAEAAFGNGEGYLEKLIAKARHVEVQILGDSQGHIYHLWERDCSVQRRNQKVVERAPAPYLSPAQREELCSLGRKIAEAVDYECAGTVEFLQDMEDGQFYFIEVNPRIQVEHTVTEEVTGIDIVRAQILIAEGKSLVEATGLASQYDVQLDGHAIQCRITTEDPQNNFIPDYGRITAYRGATGMGIRLDGGTAYSGAVITRYYDSLLEKVTAWAPTPEAAIARMIRALREFRIRGVSTNIAFVENLLRHPTFVSNEYHTKFIDQTPELFRFERQQDRATKILTYIADITVNGHPETLGRDRPAAEARPARLPELATDSPPPGAKQILDREGPDAVAEWMLAQQRLLITDTTMRDSHQSLLATRMRSFDMIRVAPAYAANLPDLFSVECWGGATFDVAYRFLQECPWQRLRDLRAAMPNLMTQMLLRGSNGVGYTNYPDNVVRAFVAQAAETGIDLFRVFDPLNWVENMRVSMDAVREAGKLLEGAICYTGDIHDPDRAKYDLKYYVQMGRELKAAGTHILGLKDMGGLMKPRAAAVLVRTLKDELGLPVHFHTHDTAGIAISLDPRRRRCRGRRRRLRDGRAVRQYQPGDARHRGRGAAPHRPRDRPRHRRDPRDLELLGERPQGLRRLRERDAVALLRGLPARDAGRPVHQPQGAGALDGAGGPLARRGPDLCRREPALRRRHQGHADRQDRGRPRADAGEPGHHHRRPPEARDRILLARQRHHPDARRCRPGARRLSSGARQEGAEGRGADHRAARLAPGARRHGGGAGGPREAVRDRDRRRGPQRLHDVSQGLHRLHGASRALWTRSGSCRRGPSSMAWSRARRSRPRSSPASRSRSGCRPWGSRMTTARSAPSSS